MSCFEGIPVYPLLLMLVQGNQKENHQLSGSPKNRHAHTLAKQVVGVAARLEMAAALLDVWGSAAQHWSCSLAKTNTTF